MAIDVHIKFDGVDGESTDRDHKGEVRVLSWGWGVTQAAVAAGAGSGTGKATPADLVFTHDYDKASPLLAKRCAQGKHFPTVVLSARKAGEGQKDFLKVTMKEVFVTGLEPANDNHIKLGFTQVLGELKDGVQTFDAYWDITGDYLLSNFDDGFTTSTHFLGIKLRTTQKFDGLSSVKYDYDQNILTFSAELQTGEGVLSLTSAPRAVDEPATLALLGTGLLGAAALRRRRRGW